MLTTMFPIEVSKFQKLKGSKKIVERSKLLVEKYPKMSRRMGVDAYIALHLLFGAAISESQRKRYTQEDLGHLSWEIHHDREIRKNERRLYAERDCALILSALADKMNPVITATEKPGYIHHGLAELGIESLEVLERFIDVQPRRADGYRGMIEKIGLICESMGYPEDVLPMLRNSIDAVGKINLDNDEDVSSKLFIIHSSLHRAGKIMSVLKKRKIFETQEGELRESIIALYIKRGLISMDGVCTYQRACLVMDSFEILDNELIGNIKEKTEGVSENILHSIVEAHMKLSDALKINRGAELINSIISEIKNATISLKR